MVEPIALTTTAISWPASTAAATESAARFTREPLPRLVPPNLATTRIVDSVARKPSLACECRTWLPVGRTGDNCFHPFSGRLRV